MREVLEAVDIARILAGVLAVMPAVVLDDHPESGIRQITDADQVP